MSSLATTLSERGRQGMKGNVSSGIAAAVVQLAVAEIVSRAMPGQNSGLAAVQRAVIDRSFAPFTDAAITVLGEYAKSLLRLSVVGGALGAGAAASVATKWIGNKGAGVLCLSGLTGALASLARPGSAFPFAVLPSAAGTAVGVLTHVQLRRRGFFAALAVAGGATLVAAAAPNPHHVSEQGTVRLPTSVDTPEPRAGSDFGIPGVRPLITPAEDFYVTHIAIHPPVPDLKSWRLRVTGEVEHEFELTYDELLAMPLIEVYSTLVCVHNHVGGDHVSTGRWLGVPVADLLERAVIKAGADQLLAHSVTEDAVTSGLPLMDGDPLRAIVAVGLNGQPLRTENGFPARLLTPGSYGQWANVKWLERLEVTRFDASPDYWAKRGWPRTGWVRPGSQIDVPARYAELSAGETTVAGVAWNPPNGVRVVEVSIDDGDWNLAELAGELAPTAWRQWRFQWNATPGKHRIRVRCDHQEGRTQSAFPDGFGGYHTVKVAVDAAESPTRRWLSAWRDEVATRAKYLAKVPSSWIKVD